MSVVPVVISVGVNLEEMVASVAVDFESVEEQEEEKVKN